MSVFLIFFKYIIMECVSGKGGGGQFRKDEGRLNLKYAGAGQKLRSK